MVQYEYLTLPEDVIRDEEPLQHEISPDSWPGKRLLTGLDWNNASGEWHFFVDLIGFGRIIPRTPAKLDTPYSYRDYFRIIFHDPSNRSQNINPLSFSRRIRMTVWPGPESDAYEPTIEKTQYETIEKEPWRDWIGYNPTTSVVKQPLPAKRTD